MINFCREKLGFLWDDKESPMHKRQDEYIKMHKAFKNIKNYKVEQFDTKEGPLIVISFEICQQRTQHARSFFKGKE